jgi:molybdopterin-synthase adenylyltransferase
MQNESAAPLSARELERYHRQIMLPGWGNDCQQRLKLKSAFIAGAGGLGSPVSLYLAAAGIGTLRICDSGEPELSNLNRQILHNESRIGINKAVSARQTLTRLNPDITVEALSEHITPASVASLIGGADIILDCLDTFETRHVLNRYALQQRIPLVHGGVSDMHGQVMFVHPPETPCLWCVNPGSPQPRVFPIVGAAAGVIGSIQALEAIKYLSGIGTLLSGTLLVWDGVAMQFTRLPHKPDPGCPMCRDLHNTELRGDR